jgi:LytS/YehU family sensor histidine kinase
VQRWFGSFFLESVITYAAIAGVLLAIDFARAYRDEEVKSAKLEARAAALEASVTQSRLEVLRMELNPHFLFNALNAVSALVGQNKKDHAQEVIGRLGELLRQTLGRGPEQLTSVAREIELLQDFLYIEHVRFSDRLRVDLHIQRREVDALPPSES